MVASRPIATTTANAKENELTSYAIAARANAALLADEAGVPVFRKMADELHDRLGIGAGSAGRTANDAPRAIERAYESCRVCTDY